MKVLVTGIGAPGIRGTLYSIRKAFPGVETVGVDIKGDVVGKNFVGKFYQVAEPEYLSYIYELQKICEKNKVDVLLPQCTRELIPLSQFTEGWEKTVVCISSEKAIKIALDKHETTRAGKRAGLQVAETMLASSYTDFIRTTDALGYPDKPVVIKLLCSNGSRGVRILTARPPTIEEFTDTKPNGLVCTREVIENMICTVDGCPTMMVTEYLPGPEYTVDCFKGKYGEVIIPRLRKKIVNGVSFETRVEMREDIIEQSRLLLEEIGLQYAFGFQFKLNENNEPILLECNPRVQGSMVASTFAGANVIEYAIREALGVWERDPISIIKEIEFKRYWGGGSVVDGKYYEI